MNIKFIHTHSTSHAIIHSFKTQWHGEGLEGADQQSGGAAKMG